MSNCYFKKTETNIPGNEYKYECGHGHIFYISVQRMAMWHYDEYDIEKMIRELKQRERVKCQNARKENET